MHFKACWLLLLTVAGVAAAAAETNADELEKARRLTLERLYSLPSLIGTEPAGFAWSADSRYLVFLWNDSGFPFRDIWLIDVEDPELTPQRVTAMSQTRRPDPTEFDSPLPMAEAEEAWEADGGIASVSWHPDGDRMLFSFRGDLWAVGRGGEPQRLTESPAPELRAAFSPDGSTLAFLRDGDLWLRRGSEPAFDLSRIAAPDLRLVDFRWSPDSLNLAVLERDERQVALRGIPDYLSEETELREVRRAYPGEPAVKQRLGVVSASPETEGIRWLDWSDREPDMILSHRWSPDGRSIALDTSDLYAKDRRIFVVDVKPGRPLIPRPVAADRDPLNETYYFWRIEWSTDSRFIYFLSDRQDDYHVWAVTADGQGEPRQLTRGSWAVAEMFPVQGGLIVVGNRGRPEERHLFRVDHDGGAPVQLTRGPGTHRPIVSPDGKWAAVHFSSQSMPPELLLTSLQATADAETERRLTHSPLPEFDDFSWVEADFVSFPSHIDGSTLHGRIARPPDFNPARKYPAIVGSVYTDSVRNQWGWRTAHPTWGLDQFLLQEGYIVFNVDMRGSWGRGRDHRRGIRLDYGGIDIEDLESGVRYLETLGYVDMDRIGIWGSSYGGLMTAMSLFRKPGLYAAGIAGAPATNVRHALTGQMAVMMRPQDQPEEYDDSSPVEHGHGLQDPLMIIHGMRDWVVLYKDSVTLVQRLILLDKNVELVTLPNAGHGWDNEGLAQTRFAFRQMVDFFARHLRQPCDEESSSHASD